MKKKTKKPVVLPRVLSDLLEIALDDMAALRRAGKVKFNMYDWLINRPKAKTCVVCMAGAVMLRRGLVTAPISERDEEYGPLECDQNTDQLEMINHMRGGDFLECMPASGWSTEQHAEVQALDDHFWGVMTEGGGGLYPEKMYRDAVRRLRSVGL